MAGFDAATRVGLGWTRLQSLEGASRGADGVFGPAGARVGEGSGLQGTSFADTLRDVLGEVSELHVQAQDTIGAFLRGEPVETHRVMAAAEEAGIALDLLIEIRNKVTEAYRAVMQMQT